VTLLALDWIAEYRTALSGWLVLLALTGLGFGLRWVAEQDAEPEAAWAESAPEVQYAVPVHVDDTEDDAPGWMIFVTGTSSFVFQSQEPLDVH